jgi:hypothetical protein
VANMPQIPDPRAVSDWLWQQARQNGRPSVEISCRTRATARVWQAILAEVQTPVPITVWLHAPREARNLLGSNETRSFVPHEHVYEAIRVDVAVST